MDRFDKLILEAPPLPGELPIQAEAPAQQAALDKAPAQQAALDEAVAAYDEEQAQQAALDEAVAAYDEEQGGCFLNGDDEHDALFPMDDDECYECMWCYEDLDDDYDYCPNCGNELWLC